MTTDPAFLFYYQDWAFGTRKMSRELKGAYMDLLVEQADNDPIPLDEIKNILGEDFARLWNLLRCKFIKERNECFYNLKLRNVVKKRKEYSASRSANRTKSKTKGKKHMINTSERRDEHMEKRKEEKKKEIENIGLKDNTPLEKMIHCFKKMRKEIKKPLSDHGTDLLRKKLEDLAPGNDKKKIKILEQSIFSSWQGVFPLKDEPREAKEFDTAAYMKNVKENQMRKE